MANHSLFEDSGEIIFKSQNFDEGKSCNPCDQATDFGTSEKINELLLYAVETMNKEKAQLKQHMDEQFSEIRQN